MEYKRKCNDFDVENDCPKNKKSYDNDCYDCDFYNCCLGKIEKLYAK